MRKEIIILVARQFWTTAFRSRAIYPLLLIVVMLLGFSGVTGWENYKEQNEIRQHYQQKARESWESNPDKHPHRMAHFGTFAFRLKYPLSMFDGGIENFTGNAVFLEAHKQNMVNFSEASLSTGLLRFGELTLAMVLQTVFPLLLFFLGFASVSAERESGTLKIMLIQGAKFREILVGKTLGLWLVALVCLLPVLLMLGYFLVGQEAADPGDVWTRFAVLSLVYMLFFMVLSIITVVVSATSHKSKNALIKLLAIWLVFVVLMPRTSQALGNYLFPSPSKVAFESAIEDEVVQKGDSHNPDDPYFKALKDSVLAAHQVDSIEDLPFNYGGFVMGVGERTSSAIYNNHQEALLEKYGLQNTLTEWAALINPYVAIKQLSMALSGTDFSTYLDFQEQAERYRYDLAQKMNELQMEHISPKKAQGSEGKEHVVEHEEWSLVPDFEQRFLSFTKVIENAWLSLLSLLGWGVIAVWGIFYMSNKVTAV
ncbi:ABC transporter permease [Echinicola rosea]|uniref:ABC transporter permease n=1 Tax=Echinicola rosea TaxID=1807691 RepID=A0ABQ1V5X2_9BACT|nr:DUF3526 domain-containing protein [Echinicola rosea]GGF36828.1 ABC transporter permease [Echinicola rosea]